MRTYLTDLIFAGGVIAALVMMLREDQRQERKHEMHVFLMTPEQPEEAPEEAENNG